MQYRKGMTDEELLAWLDSWSVEDEAHALCVVREQEKEGDDEAEHDG